MVQPDSGMEQCTQRVKQAQRQHFNLKVTSLPVIQYVCRAKFFYWDTGFQLMVWGTIAAGVGNNSVQLTIDGGPSNITSQVSNGSAIYNVVYFETPLLTETYHTAVITNLGSTTNGNSEFELDKFEFATSDVTPLFTPPTSPTPSQTQTTLPATASASYTKSSSKSPLGAIAGAVIGTLILVIGLLLFFLWRRRKLDKATGTF